MVELPEPPNGGVVLSGESPAQVAYLRDDRTAGATGDGAPDVGRWWLADGVDQCLPGLTWPEVLAKGPVERLYRQADVDAAVAAVSVERIGQHRVTPDGYCQTDGVHHNPTELDRLREREGAGDEPA